MDHGIARSVVNKLKTNASKARRKAAYKETMDKECDADSELHPKRYSLITFHEYVRKFISGKTMDVLPRDYATTMYQTNLREMYSFHYAYLNDRHVKHMELDPTWIKEQNDYLLTLSTEDIFNLYGYTHNGDVFVNNYLRDKFNTTKFHKYLKANVNVTAKSEYYFPLYFPALRALSKFGPETVQLIFDDINESDENTKGIVLKLTDSASSSMLNSEKYVMFMSIAYKLSFERFWILVLEQYITTLNDIIKNAPATKQRMVLYRGVKDDHYLTQYMLSHRERIHVANSFVSTTSSISVAHDYTDLNNNCCFIRIYVPVGMKMLLIAGLSKYMSEAEFLMGHKAQFYITKSTTETFCKGSYDFKMRVSDVVLIN